MSSFLPGVPVKTTPTLRQLPIPGLPLPHTGGYGPPSRYGLYSFTVAFQNDLLVLHRKTQIPFTPLAPCFSFEVPLKAADQLSAYGAVNFPFSHIDNTVCTVIFHAMFLQSQWSIYTAG